MGIAQGHVAKTSQNNKSSSVFSASVVPIHLLLCWPRRPQIQAKNGLVSTDGSGGLPGPLSCAMRCSSREAHAEASLASAGLGPAPLAGSSFSLPPPPARACCHAANTRAFVHEKHFDGQVSIPTFCTPLRCCRTAAGLQPPLGGTWQLLAVHGNAVLLFRVGRKGYCL